LNCGIVEIQAEMLKNPLIMSSVSDFVTSAWQMYANGLIEHQISGVYYDFWQTNQNRKCLIL